MKVSWRRRKKENFCRLENFPLLSDSIVVAYVYAYTLLQSIDLSQVYMNIYKRVYNIFSPLYMVTVEFNATNFNRHLEISLRVYREIFSIV